MQRRILLSAALVVLGAVGAVGQATTSTDQLNNFIGAAHSAAGQISSANAKQTTSSSSASSSSTSASSTSAAAASSPSPTAAPASSSHKNLIIGLVVGIVGAVLLGLLIGLLCCCLARRRHRRRHPTATPIPDEEIKTWRSDQPTNPGRTYSPPHQLRQDAITEQQPLVPNMAVAAGPDMQHHPGYRHENPFVPVPPSPRRAPNSRAGLTDGTVPGEEPYIVAPFTERQRRRESPSLRSRSRSRSTGRLTHPTVQPTASATNPPHPSAFSTIGQPYEDMHVHVLQAEEPSRELRQSLQNRGYATPPRVPSRSPRRSGFNESYDSSSTNTGSASDGSDLWRGVPHWEQSQNHAQSQNRYAPTNNNPNVMPAPPPPSAPWAETGERRNSHSPRPSRDSRESMRAPGRDMQRPIPGSPATSINGAPRRLRFSDVQAATGGGEGRGGRGYAHGGVGEAL